MKSICIKTNNKNSIEYLLNELNYIEVEPVCFSENNFKNYQNIIIHYAGKNNLEFIHQLSCILSCFVIDEEEEKILKNLLQKNYFYFNYNERNHIIEICFNTFSDDFNELFDKKYSCLIKAFEQYLINNKTIILDGFINFRLKEYINILEDVLDESVNSFIVEKEYYEFISLLKMYINSQNSNSNLLHLIYNKENSILLNENKEIIDISEFISKAKYLSDITFSSNDYALNTLLTLVPKKIYIHLIDNCIDDFINTLTLIFENRITLCNDCDICKMYKNNIIKTTIKK